jgi:CAAX prenyl protease-like protein
MNTTVPRLHPGIARATPFAIYIAFLFAGELAGELAPGLDVRWMYAIQVALVTLALAAFSPGYEELRRPGLPRPKDLLLSAAVGVAVFVAWIRLDHPWITIGSSKGFDPSGPDGGILPGLVVARIAGAALVVPVMEELFWRSFIARWIDQSTFMSVDPARLSMRAVAISSLAFGFEHTLWFAGIVAGLAYCWLYRSTGNLWAPIIAHAVTNAALGIWVVHTRSWQFW